MTPSAWSMAINCHHVLFGWIGYKLGACPHCQSDDFHPTLNPDNCHICLNERKIGAEIWVRYKAWVCS